MTQLDIFDALRARQERDDGMLRVAENADVNWKTFVAALIVEVAKLQYEFTTDDIEKIRISRSGPSTHEPRALGPLMLAAARRGICEKTGRVKTSEQVSNHGRPMQVWRSLICGEHGA